jgi:hypothetical protein
MRWRRAMSSSCAATSAASASGATFLAGYRRLRFRVRHLPGHHILGRDRVPGPLCRLCPRRGPPSLRVRHDPARADPRHQRSVLISHPRVQKPAGKGYVRTIVEGLEAGNQRRRADASERPLSVLIRTLEQRERLSVDQICGRPLLHIAEVLSGHPRRAND